MVEREKVHFQLKYTRNGSYERSGVLIDYTKQEFAIFKSGVMFLKFRVAGFGLSIFRGALAMAYEKSDEVKTAADALRRVGGDRLGVVLSGHVKHGKLILDQETLDEIAKKYPDADRAFVAMNSPFDARSVAL